MAATFRIWDRPSGTHQSQDVFPTKFNLEGLCNSAMAKAPLLAKVLVFLQEGNAYVYFKSSGEK